jgi:hypothetical protein
MPPGGNLFFSFQSNRASADAVLGAAFVAGAGVLTNLVFLFRLKHMNLSGSAALHRNVSDHYEKALSPVSVP